MWLQSQLGTGKRNFTRHCRTASMNCHLSAARAEWRRIICPQELFHPSTQTPGGNGQLPSPSARSMEPGPRYATWTDWGANWQQLRGLWENGWSLRGPGRERTGQDKTDRLHSHHIQSKHTEKIRVFRQQLSLLQVPLEGHCEICTNNCELSHPWSLCSMTQKLATLHSLRRMLKCSSSEWDHWLHWTKILFNSNLRTS